MFFFIFNCLGVCETFNFVCAHICKKKQAFENMEEVAAAKGVGRYRPGRHYFLMRASDFVDFKDPDVFSPHMDLLFLRKVYGEFHTALEQQPNFAQSLEPQPYLIPSTPYVVGTRPERAARDLARRFLVSPTTKFEIEIIARTPTHFRLRYKRSWKQFGDAFSEPKEFARGQIEFTGQEYSDEVNHYKRVQIPSLRQETVFVQFFRLEPSFQLYEYAAVIEPKQDRALRLPGWNEPINEPEEYVSFEHKILVKSMFRPFRIIQGNRNFVVSANNARDAFQKVRSRLTQGVAQIKISDDAERHRYVNADGKAQFKFWKRPVVNGLRRRVDNKRKRTHCTDHTFLFEKGNLRHAIHTSLSTRALFDRELRRNVDNSVVKFKRMAQSARLNDRMKESSTFFMLKNRWFLLACAGLLDDNDDDEEGTEILERALNALHRRNPAISTKQITYESIRGNGPPLYEFVHHLLEGVDEVPVEEYVREVDDLQELAAHNIPLPFPPSLGCAPNATETQGAINIIEGHDPFPTDLLEGEQSATFAQWTEFLTEYTRSFVLDKYVKAIRDDLPRIEKRQSVFGDYLQSISVDGFFVEHEELDDEFWDNMEVVEFGKGRRRRHKDNTSTTKQNLYEKIMQAVF